MRNLRTSIAGLMGIVLMAALGLAALRNASQAWSGAIFLLTRGVLGLAIIKAVYRRGADRAWWFGFCLFGWGYLALVEPRPEIRSPYLSTSLLLVTVRPYLADRVDLGPRSIRWVMSQYHYLKIGHGLWAMVAAVLGGLLARIVFARSSDRARPREAEAPSTDEMPRTWWLWPTIVAWAGLVLATSAVAVRAGWYAGFWAGATFLLTCGLLGLISLVAISGRGRRRPAWLSAGLLGAGYLLLVFAHTPHLPLPTDQLLNALREWIPDIGDVRSWSTGRIVHALEQPVPMTFPKPTPLSDVLKYVSLTTATSTYPGIPIYVDPIGLQEAEQSPSSTVSIDLRGIPLKTTLRLCLNQRGLDYIVKQGFLMVTSAEDVTPPPAADIFWYAAIQHREMPAKFDLSSEPEDPFLIVGHCLIALLAAGFGALAARLVAGANIRSSSSPDRS
jgi:hypothetical protein